MYQAPERPQQSPGGPRPPGRHPSPASGWGPPGVRSPYGGPGPHGRSPRGFSPYSPRSPAFSPGAHRGYRHSPPVGYTGSPQTYGDYPTGGQRNFGDSPTGFHHDSRGFRGQRWGRGDGSWRNRSFSPSTQHYNKHGSSDAPVEEYFSPLMLLDPWKDLQPITADKATAARRM
ncbi:M-phase-specific PLK1-interacting protein [Gouania willdenowi]|uniref:M-phase-specific PLK1-interacting protein n=1 Tax=Gouania willdenowi TaxID=441366 RepID=UPI00105479C4|nr:M-phase-specific PLK1-interacting protein [Gouania willdenowi]